MAESVVPTQSVGQSNPSWHSASIFESPVSVLREGGGFFCRSARAAGVSFSSGAHCQELKWVDLFQLLQVDGDKLMSLGRKENFEHWFAENLRETNVELREENPKTSPETLINTLCGAP